MGEVRHNGVIEHATITTDGDLLVSKTGFCLILKVTFLQSTTDVLCHPTAQISQKDGALGTPVVIP